MLKKVFKSNPKTVYIAEIGLNHNGNIDMACRMISAAAESGAHAVKFQTFVPELMNSIYTTSLLGKEKEMKADYSQINFFKEFSFSKEEHILLKQYSEDKNIVFFSSPFDIESAEMLESIKVPMYKIASSEVTNYPLLEKISSFGKPVILSTGISRSEEIRGAIQALCKHQNIEIILLHCVSLYPLKHESANLERINSLKKKFKLEVGFSDHTRDLKASSLTAAMGCRIFEKHFTIDRMHKCPDMELSVTSEEFTEYIKSIESTIKTMGDGRINFSGEETNTAIAARRSLFAKIDILPGLPIKASDLISLRPGTGIPPSEIVKITGKKTKTLIKKNSQINLEDLQ